MLSRVIDNMEISDFEDRVPYQYSHYLRLNVSKTCGELRRNFYANSKCKSLHTTPYGHSLNIYRDDFHLKKTIAVHHSNIQAQMKT
jgi:hypothetical protein